MSASKANERFVQADSAHSPIGSTYSCMQDRLKFLNVQLELAPVTCSSRVDGRVLRTLNRSHTTLTHPLTQTPPQTWTHTHPQRHPLLPHTLFQSASAAPFISIRDPDVTFAATSQGGRSEASTGRRNTKGNTCISHLSVRHHIIWPTACCRS